MSHHTTHARRRDWFYVIRTLMKHGVSMAQIARKCGRHPKTVESWAMGGDPKEGEARIVLGLFASRCPVEYTEHQRKYEIRVEIEAAAEQGESRALPFVG